jgi:hypothetical protein
LRKLSSQPDIGKYIYLIAAEDHFASIPTLTLLAEKTTRKFDGKTILATGGRGSLFFENVRVPADHSSGSGRKRLCPGHAGL